MGWSPVWNESRHAEYFVAGPRKLPFKPEIAYAVERYLWRHYRGVFIGGLEFNEEHTALTIRGPVHGVGVGIIYRTDYHPPDVAAKLLVENAVYTMRTYYEPRAPERLAL